MCFTRVINQMLWDSLRSIFMWGKQDYVKD